MLLKLAWRNLWRNKRRTFITMASVMFAVLLAVVMRALQFGSYDRMIENVVSFSTGYIQVHDEGYWEERTINKLISNEDAVRQQITSMPGITAAIPRLELHGLAASEELSRFSMITGVDPVTEDGLTQLQDRVVAGSYFSENDQAVLMGDDLAEYLGLGVGDTLVFLGQGYKDVTIAAKYPVMGLLHFGSPELNKRIIYLPINEAKKLGRTEGMINSLVLEVADLDQVDSITVQLRQALGADYEVMSWKEMVPELEQSIEADSASGVIMIGILYIIIGFGMFGTVLMMLAERKHEFGVLIAIGMKNIKLGWVVVMETIIISMLGCLAGLIISIPAAFYFKFNPIYFGGAMKEASERFGVEAIMIASTDPMIFLTQTFTVLVLALVLSLYPILTISKLQPVDAMRR